MKFFNAFQMRGKIPQILSQIEFWTLLRLFDHLLSDLDVKLDHCNGKQAVYTPSSAFKQKSEGLGSKLTEFLLHS